MMHNSLIAYYERIFALKQYHQWTLSDVENMLPWELDVMIALLNNYLEAVELKKQQDAVATAHK